MKFEDCKIELFDMDSHWGLLLGFTHAQQGTWRHAVRLPVGASGKEIAGFLRSFADCIEFKEQQET